MTEATLLRDVLAGSDHYPQYVGHHIRTGECALASFKGRVTCKGCINNNATSLCGGLTQLCGRMRCTRWACSR